jgi:hypothetical protein
LDGSATSHFSPLFLGDLAIFVNVGLSIQNNAVVFVKRAIFYAE